MANVPLTIVAGTLPSGAVYNPQTYFNAIVARMQATVSDGNILWGQLGGTEPSGALPGTAGQSGLWFGDPEGGHGYWNDWNTDAAKYLPIPLICGQYANATLLTSNIICGAMTADTTITTPDKSGTMALTSDLIQALGTQTFSGSGSLNIDWNNRAPVYVTLAAATSMTESNGLDGQVMDYFIENATGTTLAVTWVNVYWRTGTGYPPVQSPGVANIRVIDHYRLEIAGGILFGSVVDQNIQIAVGLDHMVPAVTQVTGQGNDITVTFGLNLMVNTALPVDYFTVIKNGTAVTVSGARSNGFTLDVTIATAMTVNDTVTIKYTGTDLKGLNGNPVVAFGPLTVTISNGGGGGIHNGTRGGGTGTPPHIIP